MRLLPAILFIIAAVAAVTGKATASIAINVAAIVATANTNKPKRKDNAI